MLMKNGRRVFSGLIAALALTGCGGTEEELFSGARPEGEPVQVVEQGTSVISGYDIALRSTAAHTATGFVMPRWTAPSTHSTNDYIALAKVGSANTEFVAWSYVGSAGATNGVLALAIPAGVDTSAQYEVRYFLNDTTTLGAKTAAFSIQPLPIQNCAWSESGGELPEAQGVSVGKTSGTVSFSFDHGTVHDRTIVYQGTSVLFDSGCVTGGRTVSLNFSTTSGRLRVALQPSCTYSSSGTGWSWNMGCAQ
jgi:hypothetical protein